MNTIPRITLKAVPEVNTDGVLTRQAAVLVRRGFLHLLLDPFTVTDLTWHGVSLLVARFNCTLDNNLAIIALPEAPESPTFCLCVAWKTAEGQAERYKVWADVGERLYAPLYDGRRIPSSFWLEVWSLEDLTEATSLETLDFKTSLVELGDLETPCLEADSDEALDSEICHDNEFALREDWNPSLGDYWTFDSCGEGTFVNVDDPEVVPPPPTEHGYVSVSDLDTGGWALAPAYGRGTAAIAGVIIEETFRYAPYYYGVGSLDNAAIAIDSILVNPTEAPITFRISGFFATKIYTTEGVLVSNNGYSNPDYISIYFGENPDATPPHTTIPKFLDAAAAFGYGAYKIGEVGQEYYDITVPAGASYYLYTVASPPIQPPTAYHSIMHTFAYYTVTFL